MDSLAYGEPYGSSIVSQSTLKRTCSLSKFKGTNEISSSSSTASSSSFSSSSSEFVTVVEVDENLKKSRQQKFPFIECENNPSSMIMSTSITPSVKQTTDIGSTIEPFVTVLEVGNQNQNRQTNGRDTGNIINNNNIVITTNDNHVNSHNDNNGNNNNNNDNKQLSTTLLEKNIVNRYLKTKTLVEQVTVYRLPGERLGMTLKFDGGANLDETIENLYIQNINPDSPASRISGSVLGRLCEGDEILDIAGEPVNTMTRKECVAALGDAPICFKMLVKRQETVSVAETTAPLQSTVDGTALTTTPQTGEVDYHKATLRRVDSENALTPPMRTRRQPPPVPPRNSTTSLTSGNSFRSPIKPPARKRPSQPPPLPPRRAKDTTGKSVTSNRPPSDLQTVSINGSSGSSGDTVIQTNTGYSGVSVDSHQIVSLVNSNGTSSVIVDCSHKGLEPDLGMTVKSMQTPKENVKLPANNQLKINDVDFSDSQDLSFDSTTMGTPYLNGTSEMIIQGIKTTDTKNSRDKSSLFDKSRNIYDALLPAPPELYMDTVSPKVNLGIESDSDDTGSSVSTIIERFSFTGNSCPSSDSSSNGSINNSFRLPVTGSNNVTSVPSSSSPSPSSTVITSNTSGNLYNSSFSSSLNHDLGKVLDPFEKLRREFDEKGSLEELIAEAKSGFSLDNLIHEKNEPRSNRSSSTDTSTATTTINSNLLSANQSSFPCSILGPPTHQAPSPPIPSLPPLSPSRYEVNLDDYDDIQSISLTYEGNNSNSTPFCEPIVEPPKSFSNTFPIIREEGESSLEYDDVNGGQKTSSKVDENFIMSAADAAIAAADSVTLDAQEILSIVENMKLDEDLTLIPSIEEPVTVKQLNIEQQQSYSVHEEDEEETNLPKSPVNGHSPLSPSSSSASSSSSSTLPVTSDVSITDGEEDKTIPSLSSLSGSSERKAINSYELNPGESKSILSPDETYADHHHRMNGDRNGHVSRHSSICSNSSNDSSPSSSSLVSTSPPSSPSSSMISPYSTSSSTSSSSPCSSDPRSSPGRLTRCSKSSTRASTTGQSVNSLIPKMVELPNRITSRSAGMLSRKSKSTLNLSSFSDFDFKPSLIPRPITSNTKPSNITTGLNSLPRSHHNNCNGYIGSLNNGTGLNGKGNHHHNHHSNHNNHTNNHHQQSTYMNGSSKNGSIIRRSKSIENMRSLAYSVSSISLSSSPSNGQDNGRRVGGGVDSFGRSKVKSKDHSLIFTSSINKNESAKKVESPSSLSFLPSNTNHNNYHHHNGSTINNNHFYNYNNHQTNGQAKPANNSCNNRKSSLVRCTERNLFNAEFTRSKSSLTSSGVNILSTSSSLLPSSSSSASSSSSPSSSASSTASSSSPPPSSFSSLSTTNGNHYNQYLNQGQGNFKAQQQQQQFQQMSNSHNRMVDLKLDLSDDEKDDIKELEELEEFIAREMKCKSESDDFLTDELFSDPLVNNNNGLNRKDNGNSNNSNINNSLSINGTSNGCHEVDSILDKSLESSFSSSSKILGFPTIPEEQEEHQSLEMINEDNQRQQEEEQEQQQSNESTNIEKNEISLVSEIRMNDEMDRAKQINGTMVNGHNNHHSHHNQQTSLEGNHEHDLNRTNNGDDDQEDQQKNTANSRVKYIVFTKIIDL